MDKERLELSTALVGDSGYLIFRPSLVDGKLGLDLVFQSEEQQKSFNFPYQIGTKGDKPSAGVEKRHLLKPNDLVVLVTDGVTDNLNSHQIKETILEAAGNGSDINLNVDAIAERIGQKSFEFSLDQYESL